jgi:hypothetical protein
MPTTYCTIHTYRLLKSKNVLILTYYFSQAIARQCAKPYMHKGAKKHRGFIGPLRLNKPTNVARSVDPK